MLTIRCVAIALAGVLPVVTAAPVQAGLPVKVVEFLEDHCFDCHGGGMKKGGLDLEALGFDLKNAAIHAKWVQALDRARIGEMPPKKKPRPGAGELKSFLAGISGPLLAVERERYIRQGRTVLRRLNRDEYENTLRDVLAMPHLQIKQELPADAEAHGFDNVSEALRISYVQMARYLQAAEKALLEAAWLAPAPERAKFRLSFKDMHRFRTTFDRMTVGHEAVLLRQPNTAQTPWRVDLVQLAFPGTYRIRIRARAATYHQDKAVPPTVNKVPKKGQKAITDHGKLLPPKQLQILSLYQGTRLLGSFDLGAEPATAEIEAHLYVGRSARSMDEHRLILYVPTLRDWGPKWKKGAYTGPAVALDWIEVEGPIENAYPTASYKVLFDDLPVRVWDEAKDARLCLPPPVFGELKTPRNYPKLKLPQKDTRFMVVAKDPTTDARRLLKRFMDQAMRRPVPATELDRYVKIVEAALKTKKPFHLAMVDGYRAILTSPDFIYLLEGAPGALNADALASRLSYFLWGSAPDAALRKVPARDPDALVAQVDRLLKDPRSDRFIERFTGQWLGLREINFTQPDKILYPEFDDHLQESMVAESHAFFRAMINEDLPARSVVDSDFVIVNEALARLYGIPGVKGTRLRKVKLAADSPRGGIITQASFLKITANGTTTSPVIRGTGVMDRLLGTPPPPPPPNVPAVEPDTRGATTIRQLLDKHRADPACASCHAKIDPPGFALESFDVIGGWRDRYRSLEKGDAVATKVRGQKVRYKQSLPVDSAGQAPDGRAFKDIHAFKKILLDDERQIARNLVERLLVHATGAGVGFADRAEVERILDRAKPKQYGLKTLIEEVVRSETFRRK